MAKNKRYAPEDKIWSKFCDERCKLKEKCRFELIDETECPIATQIVELDYVKK